MHWTGCTVRSRPENNTTIGLPFAPVRGTIIKSRIVSMRTVGNGEEWQRRNEKQRHGAQRRAKNARNSACRQGLGPVCGAFAGGPCLCGRRLGVETLHQVLFGLFGCGSFVLGAAVCCLAVLYTRGEDLLPHICKLALGLVFASGTVIVFSDIQPQGLSAFQMVAAATRTVIRRGCPAAHWVRCWAATCCCSAPPAANFIMRGAGALRQPVHF